MDSLTRPPQDFGSPVVPEELTELRWRDAEIWPVRRPYPVRVPCPVCGTFTLCDFFGRQRCPDGHAFGQRTFWSGRPTACVLLLEDLRDGRLLIYPRARLLWHDDARTVTG